MEITSKNFADNLAIVESAIDTADFLAIDGEFTGLLFGENDRHSALDTAEERYVKVRSSTSKFLLVQFGLCTFHRCEGAAEKYTNRAFNFYVWPRPYKRSGPDPRFACQTSSLDFLSAQNFDFNKLIRDGIPYLRPDEESRLRGSLAEQQSNRRLSSQTPNGKSSDANFVVPDDQKEFVDNCLARVRAWLEDSEQEAALELDKCNSFQRRLLYNTVKPRLADNAQTFHMETVVKARGERVIVLTKVSDEEVKRMEESRDASEFESLDNAVGFSRVVRRVCDSGKPVVGHNMLLDLCFTINQFVQPLPDDYDAFKRVVQANFSGSVFDTKLMASMSPLKEDIPNSSLEELLKTLSGPPFKMPDVKPAKDHPGYQLDDSGSRYHEAGFDAFATGLCYIAMRKRLEGLQTAAAEAGGGDGVTRPFANKVNMMRSLDLTHMNLGGPDVLPVRDHVFHVSFPSEWKTSDIVRLFSPFGGVNVSWLGETSAYVSMREHVPNVRQVVVATLDGQQAFRVTPYAQHKRAELTAEHATSITPAMEKVHVFDKNGDDACDANAGTKRSRSPDHNREFKRSKSHVSESSTAAKNFDEPPWE